MGLLTVLLAVWLIGSPAEAAAGTKTGRHARTRCASHARHGRSARAVRKHRGKNARHKSARRAARRCKRAATHAAPARHGESSGGHTWHHERQTEETVQSSPPSVPTGLAAAAEVERVTVSWKPSTSTVGISGYVVYRGGAQIARVGSTSYADGALTAGSTYTYTVAAVDTLGTVSAQSTAVSATPTAAPPPPPPPPPSGGEQTTWATPGTLPLSDAQAAAAVTHRPEQRAGNVSANDYEPAQAELEAFHSARNSYGEPVVQWNPLYAYVDGRDGLANPSTDDLIQWGAHKWGIPEDWLRAEYAQESWWRQSQLGDLATVSNLWWLDYPLAARLGSCCGVYQSMGITQVKWIPDGSVGAGTEPLRWESTAFNIDYQAATIRYYYDGRCGWCTSGYGPGQAWASIGAWFSPYPWNNSGAQNYIKGVQGYLQTRPWAQPGF